MASLRMLLSAVSLSITMLLWPEAGSGGAKSCAENMNEIYKRVESLALRGPRNERRKKGLGPREGSGIHQRYPAGIQSGLPDGSEEHQRSRGWAIISVSWWRNVRNEKRHFATLRLPPASPARLVKMRTWKTWKSSGR